jgi:hypothetical protein
VSLNSGNVGSSRGSLTRSVMCVGYLGLGLTYGAIVSVMSFVVRFCFFCFCLGESVGSKGLYFFGRSLVCLGGCVSVGRVVCFWCLSGGEHASVRGNVGCLLFRTFGLCVSSWLCRGECGGVVCSVVCCVLGGCVGNCM